MSVDVVYQGLTIARGVATKAQEQDIFIEMEGPMPVATRLLVQQPEGGQAMEARVQRVVEGLGAGMVVAPVSGALPAWLRHMKPPVVRTVEMEADSEFDDAPATVVQAAPLPPPPPAPTPAVVQAQAAPAPKAGVLVEKTGEIVVPQEVQVVPLAAAPSTESSPPPYEATLEMAVPADDDAKDDAGERKTSRAAAPKKQRSSKRR